MFTGTISFHNEGYQIASIPMIQRGNFVFGKWIGVPGVKFLEALC